MAKEALDQEGIEYEEVDIRSKKGWKKKKEEEIKSIPTIKVNGEKVVGFKANLVEEVKSKMRGSD